MSWLKNIPGKCPISTKERPKLLRDYTKFIGALDSNKQYADIGPNNIKIAWIKWYFNIDVDQIDTNDFNYGILSCDKKYDVIFCFEIIEHLQNPGFFMKQIKGLLKDGGVVYLSTPCKPRWMWSDYHFFEMSGSHLSRWILNPIGMRIIKAKRINLQCPPHHFGVIRPLLRMFLDATYVYKII